jgi:hypothetical protein
MAVHATRTCRLQLLNVNASSTTLFMTTDNGNGSYALSTRLTAAATYDASLYISGALAAGGAARRAVVAPAPAYAPLCALVNVDSSGSTRAGQSAQVTVRRRGATRCWFVRVAQVP